MKKGLLIIGALAIAIATVPMFAAFEAHVINVTAHIENALRVDTHELLFGTVFPQEYLLKDFTVGLSDSFMNPTQNRVKDVSYIIKQKPKPTEAGIKNFDSHFAAHEYCLTTDPTLDPNYYTFCYRNLCPYLSKLSSGQTETPRISYVNLDSDNRPISCNEPGTLKEASGNLNKATGDTSDKWVIDLFVPPIKDTIGQDWPDDCIGYDYYLMEDSKDYGCDLWLEATDFSY